MGRANRSILVMGASGQVGRAVSHAMAARGTVVAASHQHVEAGHARVDLGDSASIDRLWAASRPSLVIVAGGMTNVDRCETEPDTCWQVNVRGLETIAAHARADGATVVFFSTDHVFDGCRPEYVETDPVGPLNMYAKSKSSAEDVLRRELPRDHVILRTSWVYGCDEYRRNFVVRLIDDLRRGQSFQVPEDQWGSPTYADDLAQAAQVLVDGGFSGTFHAVGPDFVSRADLAARVCARFDLAPELVIPRRTSDLGQAAPRPLMVRLRCDRLAAAGVPPFRTIDAGLRSLAAWMNTVQA